MKNKHSILIVEDDASLRESIKNILTRRSYLVSESKSVKTADNELGSRTFDLILLDLTLPDGSGMDILKRVSEEYKNRIIIISGTGTIHTAVEAMKIGAFDFLVKPVDRDMLLATVKKAIELNQKLSEYNKLRSEFVDTSTFDKIIHKTQMIEDVIKKAKESAHSSNTILITGETGTGKELLAQAIHYSSERKKNPFITVDCASIPETLAESELFGFEKGAFTGADNPYPGKFLLGNNGTIFLDEIGELPMLIQSKLLRVLESGEFSPLKSTRLKTIDVKIITATNKDLEEQVKKGNFREDLFYRIEQIKLHIPPLRERKKDIPPLVDHFLQIANITHSKQVETIDKEAQRLFNSYSWPGNVRELKNTINEIVTFISSNRIRLEHLPAKILNQLELSKQVNHFSTLKEIEKNQVESVLESTNYNIQRSAKILGISRPSLYKKIKDYKIKTCNI